jgi:hypothetical protein
MRPAFDDLVGLLARGADREVACFTEVWEEIIGDAAPRRWRAWRRGRLARVEDPPGVLRLIAGEESYWRKWPADAEVVVLHRSHDHDNFELSALTKLDRFEYWRGWLSRNPDVVTRTLHDTTYQGRPAYRFTAPEVKGRSLELTVDAALGLVLCMEAADLGVIQRWSDVSPELPPNDDLFLYRDDDVWVKG